jgi:hypothetical protein
VASNESVILTWNPVNWATVILMAATGFVILGLVQKLVKKAQAKGSAS